MPRSRNASGGPQQFQQQPEEGGGGGNSGRRQAAALAEQLPSLGNLLTARPAGLSEQECWAVLCQAVQALQDLFLSDGASGGTCIPLVTPSSVLLSGRGRVRFQPQAQRALSAAGGPPPHLAGYLAPEYRPGKRSTDTEAEKMWIYGLGETLKRATLTSHAAAARLTAALCQVLADMTRPQAAGRASLMHLLDVISDYCKRRELSRPFSHICMDLHQEAMAALELVLDTPWGPPAMPELRSITRNSSELTASVSNPQPNHTHSIPRRWMNLRSPNKRLTREASTSMEDLGSPNSATGPSSLSPQNIGSTGLNLGLSSNLLHLPGKTTRPKSMCIPEGILVEKFAPGNFTQSEFHLNRLPLGPTTVATTEMGLRGLGNSDHPGPPNIERIASTNKRNNKIRRNPVHRAASRLYRASSDSSPNSPQSPILPSARECVGPEFVVRASLPSKMFTMPDIKGNLRRNVTVILLNGQKLDVVCNPQTTTAGQLFEMVIQKEHIEENFMLGLSALIAGDFVFLPSDTRLCKAMQGTPGNSLTLFMRVRFFLPSLRGIRGTQAKHLMYLQLRRSILEHQLPCSFTQLVDLDGLALQAEFGDYNEREHGGQDYFLLEHYLPETMSAVVDDRNQLKRELIRSHKFKMGLDCDKAEEDFIIAAQNLPHYGGHFYTASWVLKDNTQRDVWLYISAQGINLYERANATNQCGPMLYEMFEWKSIQTLCYSKHYLCILPHAAKLHSSKLKKYKLKMDYKKSYFTFRLASLHHQFFLRLRTEFTSLTSLSAQFGIPLKDMKNETNSLYKLEALTNRYKQLDTASVNAETEFRIEFRASSASSHEVPTNENKWRRCRSVADFPAADMDEDTDGVDNLEAFQNKENEQPGKQYRGLILDSSCLSGMSGLSGMNFGDKRRGVKMGTRAFSNVVPVGHRVSRSMEAVNVLGTDDLEQLSLQSVSIPCSEASIPSPTHESKPEAYVLDCSTSSKTNEHQFLPNFHETLSETLQEKLNNFSFADERVLKSVHIKKDIRGSLGMQITEGTDGKVYVQSVILGGPAHLAGNIHAGDQIVAVDGKSLLSLPYATALGLLKTTGSPVEFILSQMSTHPPLTSKLGRRIESKCKIDLSDINESHLKSMRLERTMNKLKRISLQQSENVEKHLTESCYDIANLHKYANAMPNSNSHQGSIGPSVPYHKHIRYEIEQEGQSPLSPKRFSILQQYGTPLNKARSKSCMEINNRAIIVDVIPKNGNLFESEIDDGDIPPAIALPRSLGLSRKWRGPVKYPVTPVKKDLAAEENNDNSLSNFSNSDEEQVFI